MRWSVVNLDARTVHIPRTKNGTSRVVPLSTAAVRVLEKVPRSGELVFPIVIELAAVSGHKSLKMLQRYYHPSTERLVQKLK
jgi:integrase